MIDYRGLNAVTLGDGYPIPNVFNILDAIVELDTDIVNQGIQPPANTDLVNIAFEFGKHLESLPAKSAVSSQACKYIYKHFPAAREVLARHG